MLLSQWLSRFPQSLTRSGYANRRSQRRPQVGELFRQSDRVDALEDRAMLSVDFRDAPEPYPVTRADGGAEHGLSVFAVQLGADINGEAEADFSGSSVSLSADGASVAIEVINNGGNGEMATVQDNR